MNWKGIILTIHSLVIVGLCQEVFVHLTETDPDILYTDPIDGLEVIVAKQGKDVLLSCYVENLHPGMQVQWQKLFKDNKGKTGSYPISTQRGVDDYTKYGIEKPSEYTYKLRIKSVQVGDAGIYKCFVSLTRESSKELQIKLDVLIRPEFIQQETSSDTTLNQGENFDLKCNATGKPAPTIEWSRVGNALLPNNRKRYRENKLPILGVRPEHRGIYKCTASNTAGIEIHKIRLDVTFKPIIVGPSVVEQALGYVIELICEAEANPFPRDEEVAWIKGTSTISESFGRFVVKKDVGAFNRMRYELIINGVREIDYGKYRCRIKNSKGTSFHDISLKKVSSPRKSFKVGAILSKASTSLMSTLTVFVLAIITHVL